MCTIDMTKQSQKSSIFGQNFNSYPIITVWHNTHSVVDSSTVQTAYITRTSSFLHHCYYFHYSTHTHTHTHTHTLVCPNGFYSVLFVLLLPEAPHSIHLGKQSKQESQRGSRLLSPHTDLSLFICSPLHTLPSLLLLLLSLSLSPSLTLSLTHSLSLSHTLTYTSTHI